MTTAIKFAPPPSPGPRPNPSKPRPPPSPRPPTFPPSEAGTEPNTPVAGSFPHRAAPLTPEDFTDADRAERQPLIGTRELQRRSVFYPIVVGLALVILLAVVGFGGYRLGRGAGGGRWPGGPAGT
ncbi:hypothetical protein IAT38_001379 [Cryptococcus sp. DSM 104549]